MHLGELHQVSLALALGNETTTTTNPCMMALALGNETTTTTTTTNPCMMMAPHKVMSK